MYIAYIGQMIEIPSKVGRVAICFNPTRELSSLAFFFFLIFQRPCMENGVSLLSYDAKSIKPKSLVCISRSWAPYHPQLIFSWSMGGGLLGWCFCLSYCSCIHKLGYSPRMSRLIYRFSAIHSQRCKDFWMFASRLVLICAHPSLSSQSKVSHISCLIKVRSLLMQSRGEEVIGGMICTQVYERIRRILYPDQQLE